MTTEAICISGVNMVRHMKIIDRRLLAKDIRETRIRPSSPVINRYLEQQGAILQRENCWSGEPEYVLQECKIAAYRADGTYYPAEWHPLRRPSLK